MKKLKGLFDPLLKKMSSFSVRRGWINLFRKVGGLSNTLFIILILFLMSKRLPTIYDHYKREHSSIPVLQVQLLDGHLYNLVDDSESVVLVFWATWCGPCEVELSRLQHLIANGDITASQVLAISSGEDPDLVARVASERKYTFRIGIDPDGHASTLFGVQSTPTIYFINAQKTIEWVSSGLSPLLELRVRRFLGQAHTPAMEKPL